MDAERPSQLRSLAHLTETIADLLDQDDWRVFAASVVGPASDGRVSAFLMDGTTVRFAIKMEGVE